MSNEKIQIFDKKQKWAFGMGSFAQWFINGAFNTWVFSFYFTAVKLNVLYIMLAYIIWTIWNAINDPLIGYLSDRTNTKMGRRKPYILIGTIPVLIIEIIVWIPPMGNDILQFVYLLIMLMCYDTFYTMVALPYDSLFPELYSSNEERAEVNTIKQILATLGLLVAFLIPAFVIEDLTDPSGYVINGVVTSIIVGLSLVISIKFGVKERKEFKQDHIHQFSFFEGLKYTFKNKGFVLYTGMFFLFEYLLLLLGTVIPLWGREILNSSPFMTAILLGLVFIVGILTVIIWKKLDLKLGSRKAYAISLVVYIIASIPLLFITDYTSAIFICSFMGVGFGGQLYFVYLIIADVIDEDEIKTGVRREGTFFGITNFFMRLAMVITIVTVSLVFTGAEWETYQPNPGVDVLLGLRLLMVLFPALANGVTLLCLYFYPYPKEKVDEIKKQMAEIHEKKIKNFQSR